MKIREVLHIAWEAMNKNKVRSLLTMLGIIIGVASVIIMVSISAGTEAAIKDQITSLGSNLIFIQSSFSRMGVSGGKMAAQSGGLVYDDADALAEVNGVTGVVVEQIAVNTVKAGGVSLDSVNILGSTADLPRVRDMEIAQGRFFTKTENDQTRKVAVLGASLATELFGEEDPIGQTILVDNTRLNVIGVFEERGQVGDLDYDARLYVPISVVLDQFTQTYMGKIFGDRVKMIYVEIDDQTVMDDTILQIELLLAKRHEVSLEEADFVITTQQQIIQTQESTTSAFRDLLAWVAGVSLVVGGIGIMNIMLVSVTERTREIGIRQSVGATPGDIRSQFLTEAILLSLVGGLLGVAVGVGGSWLFGKLSDMRTVISFASIILAFLASATVGVFFGFYPANKAAELDPIEALRYE